MLTRKDRIRGSVLGHALGDALGAPFEFAEVGSVRIATGKDWIDELCPFMGPLGPHGPWVSPTVPGTGTDDVRYNRLFLDLVVELDGRMPTDHELARLLLDVYEHPGEYFPGFEDLARAQFEMWEGVSRGCLGQASTVVPGVEPAILATRSVGLNYPTIAGLLLLPSAGLLFPGDPEAAYQAAYKSAYFDLAYAREATALFAAAQSLALSGMPPAQMTETVLRMDPLRLGGYFGGPYIKQNLPPLLDRAQGMEGPHLAGWLSTELRNFSVFDPYRALAITFCALQAYPDAPMRALEIAANQMDVALDGTIRRYADIDCYAGITGALVGTICGVEALPAQMLEQVLTGNRSVYGMELEEVIERFVNAAA
jgi:ADP-ribosylglycohydrolase